jgi:hypothetical protein
MCQSQAVSVYFTLGNDDNLAIPECRNPGEWNEQKSYYLRRNNASYDI